MREPVGPVGQLLVGAAAAVADQRGVVAEAALDHAVGQLHRGVEALRIVETVEQELRPLVRRRQMVARERIGMGRWVRASSASRQDLPGDHDPLHVGSAFVDAQGPDLPVQPLDDLAGADAVAAMELHRLVDDRWARSVA